MHPRASLTRGPASSSVAQRPAPNLSDPFVEEDFRCEQALGGAKELKPRWKRAIETIDALMGEALGRIYVEQRFGAQAKQPFASTSGADDGNRLWVMG